jgi:AcrR family transcriptional regulator
MARVQAVALDLFERDGLAGVSIEAIAQAAEVGPATIYRNFGTKERIVLWDEYDPLLLAALARELADQPVLTAVPRALAAALAGIYRDDRVRILRRARLIRATPALQLAASADQDALRAALARVLRESGRARDDLAAQVFAGALAAALVAGVDRWLDRDGREPLGRSLTAAFDRLRRLADA